MSELTLTALTVKAAEVAASLATSNPDVDFTDLATRLEKKFHKVYEKDQAAQKRANAVSGGGFRKGGSGGSKPDRPPITPENAGQIKLGGKFRGKTVAEVYHMGATEAFNNHGYADRDGNPKAGRGYVEWLSGQTGELAKACKLYIESQKSEAPAEESSSGDEEFDFGAEGGW